MIDIVLDHGGNIDKFQATACWWCSGAQPHGRPRERAYEAAQAMVRAVTQLNAELEEGGKPRLHWDRARHRRGGAGMSDRQASRVHTDRRPRQQQRLSVEGAATEVLLSETTKAALPDGVTVIDYEPMLLKGASEKQPIYQLEIVVVAESNPAFGGGGA